MESFSVLSKPMIFQDLSQMTHMTKFVHKGLRTEAIIVYFFDLPWKAFRTTLINVTEALKEILCSEYTETQICG